MKFKFLLVLFGFMFIFSSSLFASTIIPTNGCTNNTTISLPKYCTYDINTDLYIDYNNIQITVTQASKFGNSSNYTFNTDINSNHTFSVYTNKYNLPTYILATAGIDKVYLDEVNLIGGSEDLNITKTYYNIDKESVTSKWLLGLLFALIGMMLLFDAFFSDRFKRYI